MNIRSRIARRHIVALVLVLTGATGATWASAQGEDPAPFSPDSHARAERTRAFWKALDLIGFRGLALVAEGGGRPLLWEGSGGVDPAASFDLASIAKSITAIAVLRLAHAGKLALEDPLEHFFPAAPPDKKAITVHQLLTHTGGLGNPTGDTAAGVLDRGEAVRLILATPLAGKPGVDYGYSNDGYTLLAAILEIAASKTWEAAVRDEVLRPAEMEHTFFLGDPLPQGTRALARGATPIEPGTFDTQWGAKGGAGVCSTADDLLCLMKAAEDGRLLGPQGLRELGQSEAPAGQFLQYSHVFNLREVPSRECSGATAAPTPPPATTRSSSTTPRRDCS
jgi:CubicO group peptidase (beta-lactamase class C family)